MANQMLRTKLCGVELENPFILASGYLGTSAEIMARVAKSGAGAVTTKSCSLHPRPGHKNPTVIATEHFIINAVGLSNPGAEEECKEIKKFKKLAPNTPIIASVFADSVENFGKVASVVSSAEPHFIEVNISCPNVKEEFGTPFSATPQSASSAVAAAKKATSIPLIVKLSPNVYNLSEIAKAVERTGAQAINASNTLGPGMIIDVESGKPVLENKTGGVSGPAIKPITVKCVYELSRETKLPLIGTGGVQTGIDAAELAMAGATAIGIGSSLYYRGADSTKLIAKELEQFLRKHKHKSLSEIRGLAHK